MSHNFMYSDDQFKITSGTPKEWIRKGDSGKNVTYQFCPICPTIINVKPEMMPGINIVKLGTLDDEQAISNPEWNMELYTKRRLPQCEPLKGVPQKESGR